MHCLRNKILLLLLSHQIPAFVSLNLSIIILSKRKDEIVFQLIDISIFKKKYSSSNLVFIKN